MNVNEIYNLIKNAVCLQCRKDKAIYDILKQLATVRAWYRSANRHDNTTYFADYKGGTVSIVEVNTGNYVYTENI